MNILIVGGGLLGRKVAELLCTAGHDVSVIDEVESNISQLGEEFDGVTSVGFPMDLENLRSAGIQGCDAVAVTTADDNLNITVGQIAKDYFGVEKVVARISDPYRENIFESFGLQTVCPTNMAGEKIVSALVSPFQSKQITFGTTTVSMDVRQVDKKHFGKRLSEIEVRQGDGVFGVLRKDGQFVLKTAEADPQISPGDFIVYSRKID